MSMVLASNPTSLVAVDDQCAAVEAWAEQCESIPELRDATNRLAAIDEYLTRTSTEGRGRVAAAMRRLEVRIGKLLGPAEHGGDRKSDQVRHDGLDPEDGLTRHQRTDFRQMAENEDEVEDVIAESTDEAPASRRKITDRIRAAKEAHPKAAERLAVRIEKATKMAAEGYTSRQIADELGYTPGGDGFREFRLKHGIEVPADNVVGRVRRHDSNRVMEALALAAVNVTAGSELIDYEALDRDRLDEWASSLTSAISSLTTIKRKIKELTQ